MSAGGLDGELAEVVSRFRDNPGFRSKSFVGLVTEILGPTDWLSGPGDDAAAIGNGDEYILAAGEAIFPPYVEADPFGAGFAAVLTNVNDVAAMGGRSIAIVDTVVGPEALARSALEGMRFASRLFGVPVVGGHLTVREGPPALSAFVVGRASRLLAAGNVAPGQELLIACCLEGTMHPEFPYFSSLSVRGAGVADDIQTLPAVAEAELCVAAKDVSMAGILGALAMLLESTGAGAAVDLEQVPRPGNVPLSAWLNVFPSFGFLLCTQPQTCEDCRKLFVERGLACEKVGKVDDTGRLRVRKRGQEAILLESTRGAVTHLGSSRVRALDG